ncbi:MAG: CotH kinase family protein [Saprospiraceae bacterium]|nr:CotH kinase family protein [Saprospiraceae bacterium]
MLRLILCLSFFGFIGGAQAQDLYDLNKIVEVRITFNDSNWAHKLDSLKELGTKERLVAEVSVNGTIYKQVGVRYKGNSSYFNIRKSGSVKLPFNLEANYIDKDQTFEGGYETLKLSNVFRDPSYLREVLSYEIAGKYMPAPRANFAKVYVNGEYLGLYNNTESIDDKFLEDHFGNHKGTFVKCDPEWPLAEKSHCPKGDKASLMYLGDNPNCYMGLYEIKSKKGWSDLIQLTKTLNESPEDVDTILNIDHALWMLAFNSVLVNLDSYTGRLSHNYYIYRQPNGQFSTLVWDMNLSFGGFRFAGTDKSLSNEEMQTLSPFLHYKTQDPKRPLITNLFNNNLYRKVYLAHIRTILEENFVNGAYKERITAIQEVIAAEVEKEPHRLYPYEGFMENTEKTVMADRAEIIGISELMEARTTYLLNHSTMKDGGPDIKEVGHIIYGPTLAFNATIENTEKAWLAYRLNPEDAFSLLEMFDDSSHNDEMAGDNIWGATLDYQSGIQYYIIAEGEKSAQLSPTHASYEFHKVE